MNVFHVQVDQSYIVAVVVPKQPALPKPSWEKSPVFRLPFSRAAVDRALRGASEHHPGIFLFILSPILSAVQCGPLSYPFEVPSPAGNARSPVVETQLTVCSIRSRSAQSRRPMTTLQTEGGLPIPLKRAG